MNTLLAALGRDSFPSPWAGSYCPTRDPPQFFREGAGEVRLEGARLPFPALEHHLVREEARKLLRHHGRRESRPAGKLPQVDTLLGSRVQSLQQRAPRATSSEKEVGKAGRGHHESVAKASPTCQPLVYMAPDGFASCSTPHESQRPPNGASSEVAFRCVSTTSWYVTIARTTNWTYPRSPLVLEPLHHSAECLEARSSASIHSRSRILCTSPLDHLVCSGGDTGQVLYGLGSRGGDTVFAFSGGWRARHRCSARFSAASGPYEA